MRFSAVAVIVVVGILPVAAFSQTSPSLVGTLRSNHGIEGCSWSATFPGQKEEYVFLAEYDLSKAYMNILGEDRSLTEDAKQTKGDLKGMGHVLKTVFTAEGLSVVATFRPTFVCPPSSASCEVTMFDVEFTVTAGDQVQVVQGAGDVGC